MRPLDSLTAKPLPGTEDARHPFWSPDSRFIGFFAQDKLKKLDLVGSPAKALCNVSGPGTRGGAWNRDQTIVFTSGAAGDPLYRVPAEGGEPTQVATPDLEKGQTAYRFPQFLPDGRRFLYYARSNRAESRGVYVGSPDGQQPKRIADSDSQAIFAAPGWLLFLREGSLMAQRFDANTLELTGQTSTVAEQVAFVRDSVEAYFSASESGVLIYRIGGGQRGLYLKRASGVGDEELLWQSERGIIPFDCSKDGRFILFSTSDPQTKSDLWVLPFPQGETMKKRFACVAAAMLLVITLSVAITPSLREGVNAQFPGEECAYDDDCYARNCNLDHNCNLNGCFWAGETCYPRSPAICSSGWCCAGYWNCGAGGNCWYAHCA